MFHSFVRSQHHPSSKKKTSTVDLRAVDLPDLCFVDDLVSLLIFWRKRQLSRFAEMVSQVLESGRLRANKSKLEVLVGGVKQFEPQQVSSILGAS